MECFALSLNAQRKDKSGQSYPQVKLTENTQKYRNKSLAGLSEVHKIICIPDEFHCNAIKAIL